MPEINYELLQEMIDCVKREVSLRYSVYPRLIKSGKMTPQQAEKEKALMYGVQKCLQKIYDGTAPRPVQAALFDTAIYKPQDRRFY
jgi:hypothetical protein